ncbi:hypothetical protein BS47DRAFT_1362062 [Hydnum rufescens UP504]|uniref:JmjC domain-containing protein n=1 Tax=Hydnum rufescens UP504 TaxID=1448309 RepID=A0A9P6AXT2_9AGAM|nr:hypothetical protein BS47DRAFT_1362062 [Hydnum rufescens UP504]
MSSSIFHAWAKGSDASSSTYLEGTPYTKSPSSVLTGSLAGICWRWPRSRTWLDYSPKDIEAAVESESKILGAHSALSTCLAAAARNVANWMSLALTCKDALQAVDLGLIPVTPDASPSIIRTDSKATNAFINSTRSLLLMDILFWYLDESPAPTPPSQHPLYNSKILDDIPTTAQKLPALLCFRLQTWEGEIVSQAQIESRNITSEHDKLSAMPVEKGLAYILQHVGGQASWGKAVRNVAAVALGVQSLLQPEDAIDLKLKVSAERSLIAACSISPIALLLPEVIDPIHREITRYEWLMMWRFGQPPAAARGYDKRTLFMERTIWDAIMEINTGERSIFQTYTATPETPGASGPNNGKQRHLDIQRFKDIILSAIQAMNEVSGPDLAGLKKKPNKKAPKVNLQVQKVAGELERVKALYEEALQKIEQMKMQGQTELNSQPATTQSPQSSTVSSNPKPRPIQLSDLDNLFKIHPDPEEDNPTTQLECQTTQPKLSPGKPSNPTTIEPSGLTSKKSTIIPLSEAILSPLKILQPSIPDQPSPSNRNSPNIPACACGIATSGFQEDGRRPSQVSRPTFVETPPNLPEGDEAYFPSEPDWETVEFEDAGEDRGLIAKLWFNGAYCDRTALNKRAISEEKKESAGVVARDQGPYQARQADSSVFWARGERSMHLVLALRSAYDWLRAKPKQSPGQLDLFLMGFLNCAKNTFLRRSLEVPVYAPPVGPQVPDELVGKQVSEQLGEQLEKEVEKEVGEQVGEQLEKEVSEQVGEQLEKEVGEQVGEQLEKEIGKQSGEKTNTGRETRSKTAVLSTETPELKRKERSEDTEDSTKPKKQKVAKPKQSGSKRGLSDDDKDAKQSAKKARKDIKDAIATVGEIERVMRKNGLQNISNTDNLSDLSAPAENNPEVIYEPFAWHTWKINKRGELKLKEVVFRYPVWKSEKDKNDEDDELPDDQKRPSQYRDWKELSAIMEQERAHLPTSPNKEADSPSFLKVLSGPQSDTLKESEATDLFRKHAILVVDTVLDQTWSREAAASILHLRPSTRVPVHVLNERTLKHSAVIRGATIGDVIDEGLLNQHRSLNVLSIPLTSPTHQSPLERILASDTESWHSTMTAAEAVAANVPPKTKWWGMLTLSGCMHSPHIDSEGLCTTMTMHVGYKVFVICKDPYSFSLAMDDEEWTIEGCLKSAQWQVVVIPPGGTLFIPAGHIHFAFTPELVGGAIPGAIARGTHFYSWCRLSDTLRGIFRLTLTERRITNAEHDEVWTLLSRMLLDLSMRLENGESDIPAPGDFGDLLVLILRYQDLGFEGGKSGSLKAALQIAYLRAKIVLEKRGEEGTVNSQPGWKIVMIWILRRETDCLLISKHLVGLADILESLLNQGAEDEILRPALELQDFQSRLTWGVKASAIQWDYIIYAQLNMLKVSSRNHPAPYNHSRGQAAGTGSRDCKEEEFGRKKNSGGRAREEELGKKSTGRRVWEEECGRKSVGGRVWEEELKRKSKEEE